MGEEVLSTRTAQRWFNRFKNSNFELDDLSRSSRPMELEFIDLLKQLGCFHTAVEKHLNELHKTWKYGVWIPHELSLHQLQHRFNACMDLTTYHRNYQWLRILITGDEKWVLYINYTHRRQ